MQILFHTNYPFTIIYLALIFPVLSYGISRYQILCNITYLFMNCQRTKVNQAKIKILRIDFNF